MARTLLTPISIPGPTSVTPVVCTFTAYDTVNFNKFASTGREVVLVKNVHATVAKTVTVTSVADERGRTGDITAFSIAATLIFVLPFFTMAGWRQTDGTIYIDGADVNIQFCVLTVP